MDESLLNRLEDQLRATEDKKKKIELGLQVCEMLANNGSFEEARAYGTEFLKIANKINDLDKCYDISSTIAKCYAFQGVYTDAKHYFERALLYADQCNNSLYVAKAYNNLGNVTYNSSDPQIAMTYYIKAIAICENNSYFDLLIKLYNNVGNILIRLKKYTLALDYFKKALKLIDHSTNPERLYYYIGSLYRETKKYSPALRYLYKSYKILSEKNDIYYLVHCLICLGEVYSDTKRYKKAKFYATQVYDYALKYELMDHFTSACLLLADIYQNIGDLEKAHSYFLIIEDKLSFIEGSVQLLLFYQQYNEFCLKINDLTKAHKYLSKYVALKDKTLNEEFMKNVTVLKETFDYEQKKREAEIFKLRNIELVKSQKVIEKQKNELLVLNEEKDNILSTISHDLTN